MNLIFSKLGLSSLPCKQCRCDTLHVSGVCNTCSTRHEPEVIHREISGRDYHRIQGAKDWQKRVGKA